MAKRAKPEEIIAKLREVEVRLSQQTDQHDFGYSALEWLARG